MVTKVLLSTLIGLWPRRHRRHRGLPTRAMVLASIPVLFFGGPVAPVHATQTGPGSLHCKVYHGIEIKKIGEWTRTDILVPRGAIVAILSEGEIWESTGDTDQSVPTKKWQPWQSMRFRIGEDGPVSGLFATNMQVVRNWREGVLQFRINLESPLGKQGGYKSRILIWDRDQQDRVEEDIDSLIGAYPERAQYRHLLLRTASGAAKWGDYALAQRILTRLRNEAPTRTDPVETAHVFATSTVLEQLLGNYELGKAYADQTLDFARRGGNPEMEASGLYNQARSIGPMGKYHEAIQLYEKGFEIAQRHRIQSFYGPFYEGVGWIHFELKYYQVACKYLQTAVEEYRKDDTLRRMATTLLKLGRSQLNLNLYQEAKQSLEYAIVEASKLSRRDAFQAAHAELGRIAEREGDDRKAFEHYAVAIETLEALRGTILDPGTRARFAEDKSGVYGEDKSQVYGWMIQLLLRMQRVPEAWHFLERAKALNMLELLGNKALSSQIPEEKELLSRERALRQEIQGLSAELGQSAPGKGGGGAQVPPVDSISGKGGHRGEIEALRGEHRAILEKLERMNPELASLITVNPLKVQEIQTLLEEDVALLEYFTASQKSYAWLVSRDHIRVYEIGVSEKELKEKVDRLLIPNISNRTRKAEPVILQVQREEKETSESEREENRRQFLAVSKELYETVLAPVSVDIKAKNLIVVPYGVLHKVPFGALTDGSQYQIDKHAITVLPSASVLGYVVKKRKAEKEKALVLANPRTEYQPLGYAELEGRMVESLFPKPEAYYRERATETTAKQRISDFNVVHFATHGEFNELEPMQSGLLLARDEKNDGYLRVIETFDLDLKNANLVTLSACETALSKVQGGDDLVGLSRGFIHAGTPSILATFWKVDDGSTSKLMQSFYRNWKSGMSKAEALRQAQEAVKGMKGYEHPYYWAPFVMIGDWK